MFKKSLILFLGLTLSGFSVTAMEIEGVDIPDTLSLPDSDKTLVLNGIYIGALYLESKTNDVNTIMNDTGAASVLMHFLYSEVTKDKLTDGWTDGFENNLSRTSMQAIEERVTMFNKLFQTVHEGDVIRLDYLPNSGTQVRINGELRGTVEGNDFFRALLAIWLGERPVTKALRKDMRGE